MQQSHEQRQGELQALQEELQTLRQEREDEEAKKDRELLVMLTKQAERTEESARQLTEKLQEKVSIQGCLQFNRCYCSEILAAPWYLALCVFSVLKGLKVLVVHDTKKLSRIFFQKQKVFNVYSAACKRVSVASSESQYVTETHKLKSENCFNPH